MTSLENAKRALIQKLTTDPNNQDFLNVIEDFFARISSDFTLHEETIEKNEQLFTEHFKHIEEKLQRNTQDLHTSNIETLAKIDQITTQTRQNYSNNIKTLEVQFIADKNTNEAKLQELDVQFKEATKTYQQEYNKTYGAIKKQLDVIKSSHNKHTESIEKEKTKIDASLTTTYQNKKQEIFDAITTKTQDFNERLIGLQHVRDLQSKAHDDDYIIIKTHYNTLLKYLNQHINKLKQLKQKSILDIQFFIQSKQEPIEASLSLFETQTKNTNEVLKIKLIEKTEEIHQKRQLLVSEYENALLTIQTATAQAVSLLNSKLSNFRELTEANKKEVMRAFHTKSEEAKFRDVADKNQKLKKYDNELNDLILTIRKNIKYKKLEGEQQIFELNKKHQIALNTLFYDLKKLQLDYDLNIKKSNLLLLQHQKHHTDKMSRLNQQKKHVLDQLESHYQFELSRYETQLLIATESQERDLNQMSQDVFIDITTTDIDIEKLKFDHDLFMYNEQHQLQKLDMIYHYDIDMNQHQTKRSLERENLIKSLLLDEQQIREKLAKNNAERLTLEDAKHYFNLETELLEQKELQEFNYQHDAKLLKMNFDFDISKRDYLRQEHSIKVSLRRDLMASTFQKNRNLFSLEKQFQMIKNSTYMIFKQFSYTKKIKYFITTLYDKPAHPEIIRQYLTYAQAHLEDAQEQDQAMINEIKDLVLKENELNIHAISKTTKTFALSHIQAQYEDAKNKINVEEHTINQAIYDIEVIMKQQKTVQNKDDLQYEKLKKQKTSLMFKLDALDKMFQTQESMMLRKIKTQETSLFKYHHMMKKSFDALILASKQFYRHQLYVIQQLQHALYLTKSILDQQIKSANKHDDLYHQKIIFHTQSLNEVLMLQHEHASELEAQSTKNQELLFNNALKVIKARHEEQLSLHHSAHALHKQSLDSFIQTLKFKSSERIKAHLLSTSERFNELSKFMSKDETTLQQFQSHYEKTLDYFDLNTKSLNEKFERQNILSIESTTKSQQEAIETLKTKHLNTIDQLQSKIKTTEINIESRLSKYRMKVSKFRDNLNHKEVIHVRDGLKLQKLHQQKLIQQKVKTKKLLHAQQKELQRFATFHHEQSQKLIKMSHARIKNIIKTVSRGHRFKSKMMDLS